MASEHIQTSLRDGVRKILLNRPQKKNAMTGDMYKTLTRILNEDASNDKIVLTIITGVGDFYSSGNDIKSAMESSGSEESQFDKVRNLIEAFINYPKIIIAVINGPAIGIATTTAALCDIVYASDRAFFDTPFIKLGLCAEGASSYTFPNVLGRSKASEMLLLNKKLTAHEAYTFGFVSQVIKHNQLGEFIEELYQYGKLSVNIVKTNKELLMANIRKTLTQSNEREIEGLKKCIDSEEFANAVMSFMQKKSKL